MSRRTNSTIFSRAQELRHNLTEPEVLLWSRLRSHQLAGVGFRRQHAIGPYIVDFCAPRARLIIELDGSQHLDQQVYDAERSAFLSTKGYRLLRFWNVEVLQDIERVLQTIAFELITSTPTPTPPPNLKDLGEGPGEGVEG